VKSTMYRKISTVSFTRLGDRTNAPLSNWLLAIAA